VFKTFHRPAVVAAILLVPIGLAGCGESSEEKATAQVCSSTKEIQAQLSKLSSLSLSSKAPEEIKAAASVIEKEAAKIEKAAPNLPAASTSQLHGALDLGVELQAAAKRLVSTAKSSGNIEAVLKESAPEVKTVVAGLSASYKQAYESLKCS
jgi:hypothetical protein